jgi:chromate transporter
MSLLQLVVLVFTFNVQTFGNGPTMVPLLHASLVERTGVLTQDQLLYAFTIARVTPGQANVYVASVGTMLYGLAGALLTTLAILVPGYLMLPVMALRERRRNDRAVAGFVRGLTGTSVGLIFAAAVDIAGSSLQGWVAWVVFVVALGLIQVLRLNSLVSILLAGGLGLLLHLL